MRRLLLTCYALIAILSCSCYLSYKTNFPSLFFQSRKISSLRVNNAQFESSNFDRDFLEYIDISTSGDRSLLKKVVRRGNPSLGFPRERDTVEISWIIKDLSGSILHSFSPDSVINNQDDNRYFSFRLGSNPSEVIIGWEYAVSSMLVGETASFVIDSSLAFGVNGALPIFKPNMTIVSEITLYEIIQAPSRKYESIGKDESIKEELMTRIQKGETPIAPDVGMPQAPQTVLLREPVNSNSEENEELKSSSSDRQDESSTGEKKDDKRQYFDSSKHHLDPNRRVSGRGAGHSWDENVSSIDVHIPLPNDVVSKDKLIVSIASSNVVVAKSSNEEVIFSGHLFGKILPSQSSWAIVEDDPSCHVRGTRIMLSLEKAHGFKDIWASFLAIEDTPQEGLQLEGDNYLQ